MKKLLIFIWLLCMTINMQAQFSGSGSGTEDDPYLITTEDDLFDVRNNLSAHYKLMNDLDLTEWIAEESPRQGWAPIGNSENESFTGVFDGNNHSIGGLFINKPNVTNVGLFGYVDGAIIHNITLNQPNIIGKENVGAVVGYGKNVKITNVILNQPIINGASNNIGGLAGTINYSNAIDNKIDRINIFNATIEASGSNNVGSLFGYSNQCDIDNIYIKNTKVKGYYYVGGMVGLSESCNIHNISIINPNLESERYIGGCIGKWSPTSNNEISQNYIIGATINGKCYLGGIVGYINFNSDITINSCYSSGFIHGFGHSWEGRVLSDNTFVGGIVGFSERGSSSIAKINIVDCRYDGNLSSDYYYVSGISNSSNCIMERNIFSGNISGNSGINGICWNGEPINNICCADMIMSVKGTPYRIGGFEVGINYGYSGTVMKVNDVEIETEDGGKNGISYGLRTLKRKSTYTSLGYDFDSKWSIVEGKSLPYNNKQSTPPDITSYVTGTNAMISGIASGYGKVYVFVNDNMIEGKITDGTWQIALGEVTNDDDVRVSVETNGMKPSILVKQSEGGTSTGGNEECEFVAVKLTNEYATLCSTDNLDFTNVEGVKAYIAAGYHDGVVMLMRSDIVSAGEGVLLHGNVGTYSVPVTDKKYYYTNLLRGVTETTTIEPTDGAYTNFILTRGSTGIGFYPVSKSGSLSAGKAYMQLPTAAISTTNNARLNWMFDNDNVNGINDIQNNIQSSRYYTLDGVMVNGTPSSKGIYISNGKKIVIVK